MEIANTNYIYVIQKSFHRNMINKLLEEIYDYKIQGINHSFTDHLILDNKKIYLTKVVAHVDSNIKIFIIELSFLRTKKDIIKNNFYTYCVECGKIHAQHKYKSCGHSVNFLCGYDKFMKNNKCEQCNKNIIKQEIKLNKVNNSDTCSICLEECNTVLPKCNHHFHKFCLKSFYTISKQKLECPMCREKLFPLSDYSKKYINLQFELSNKRSGLFDIIIQEL